ncbi:hypothetical protein [Altererythrobacter fulvus]|uniref:hypothetical protein n=1 Tax=Caenibius fulvus TaxID=2126012 RepID=UPI003018B9E8
MPNAAIPDAMTLRTLAEKIYPVAKMTVSEIANELANEWLEMLAKVSWSDHAKSIHARSPFPCGETTSVDTSIGLLDVSDTERWTSGIDGDIELIIEVYDDPDGEPLAKRSATIRRPA